MRVILLTGLLYTSIVSFANSPSKLEIETDKVSGCMPLNVHFSVKANDSKVNYLWDFGNGVTSNDREPSAFFLNAGQYNVKVYISYYGALVDSAHKEINVFSSPKAEFILPKTTGCVNEPMEFISQATANSSSISKYLWGFGDGSTATSVTAIHSFKKEGNYNVTLVVTDINGCTADKTSYSSIVINSVPVADFTPSSTSSCNETEKVFFRNHSTGKGISYTWNYGDGNTATEFEPSYVFAQGKHQVSLTVTDINGCASKRHKEISITKLEPDFIASKEHVCAGELVKFINMSNYRGNLWSWNFGDSSTSSACHAEKTYTKPGIYTVQFILTDGSCSSSVTKTSYIHVSDGKIPSFTSDVTSSCVTPFHVKFKNTSPNTAVSFWEFGDGTISTETNPEKVFTNAGSYKISLSATDSSGCVTKKKTDNYIYAAKPLARFTGESFGCANYPVKFSNLTPSASSYLWDFGDGETSTEKNPSHIYKQNGVYTVSLTARNGEFCDSTFTLKNFVTIDTIKINFTIQPAMSNVPPFVCLFNNKTNTAGVKYMWDFGDGYTDTNVNPSHIYAVPGNFDVRLVAYTKSGCTNSKVVSHSLEIGTTSNSVLVKGSF